MDESQCCSRRRRWSRKLGRNLARGVFGGSGGTNERWFSCAKWNGEREADGQSARETHGQCCAELGIEVREGAVAFVDVHHGALLECQTKDINQDSSFKTDVECVLL